ncbi:hypothetical protein GM658_15660 [Pseudoduganella eburnea]|uniref:Uncharacterized protein n=1 Tax=Massilia eburnea TaxID=1776165 RepID=A0A6L6QI22_9BURK|nr:hypothetical protein [Massilia eburnea]
MKKNKACGTGGAIAGIVI